MPTRRSARCVSLLVLLSTGGGCTLAKPLVGAVTGPVVALGQASGMSCGCDGDARGIIVVLGAMSVAGAVCGLVTGIVSDVNALSGRCEDPYQNWWDPFATN